MDSEAGLAPSTTRQGAEQRQGEQVATLELWHRKETPRVSPAWS